MPPSVVFGPSDRPWRLSPQGVLVSPEGQEWVVLAARVTRLLAHLRVRSVSAGRGRSLLFHALNTPEPGFRQLRARLRWAPPATAVPLAPVPVAAVPATAGVLPLPGNLPPPALSQLLTHGASGEDHGGLGLANSRDR